MNLKKIANIILISILLFSSYQIGLKVLDYKKSEKLYSDIQQIVATTEEPKDNKEDKPIALEEQVEYKNIYEKLKGINSDYQFWVEVEGTNINYPVVQSQNNSFYLKKDFNKKNSSSGTIFMDSSNNFDLDKNIVLYGHNMRNKTMFNNITKFKKRDFFNKNNKIKIKHDFNGAEYVYEVFSVYYTDNTFDYNTVEFTENYSFLDFINDVKAKSIYNKEMNIEEDDKILTLSTCSYEFKGAKTTIHAKLIQVN